MPWRRGHAVGGLLLVLSATSLMAPTPVAAQGRFCDLVQPVDYQQIVNARGEAIIYFRDPVRLRCTGDVRLAADSAVINRAQAVFELIGSVVYEDSTSRLTADWANYIGSLEQVLARGDVVLTDLGNGSTGTGETLQYLRASASRPTSHVVLRGGRPHAVLRDGNGATEDTAPPLEVTADRLEFVGDTLFLARGAVDLERGTTTGAADSARYHQSAEQLVLIGDAHVRDDRYRLEGERIDAFVRGEALREVRAEGRTRVVSEDLTVRSERLHIGFVDGALDRMQAWNPPDSARSAGPPGDSVARERALALTEGFRLRADSIDARADSGVMREVRAVGRGYGERVVDSVAVQLPPMVARDWIQGDTIIGYFTTVQDPASEAAGAVPAPGAPAEADSAEVVLERVVVIGGAGPALSLYRTAPEAEGERGAINFMKASRIILFMTEGEVSRVEAEGPLDGVYLDPLPAGQARPAGEGG